MKIINVDKSNLNSEHICCAISENDIRVQSKKSWMNEQFDNGLVFKKYDIRGKLFIEYIPIENAFDPVIGNDYMYINCFWISGKYKGKGYANELLESCIEDAKGKGKRGLVVLAGNKKKPFLSDGNYFKYKGFKIADTMEPYYELLYLNFDENDKNIPSFIDNSDSLIVDREIVLYYSNQCPHTEMYVKLIKDIAIENNIDMEIIKFNSNIEAKKSPNPFTTYSIYFNGKFITNEVLSEKKFIKLISDYKLGGE